MELLTTVLPYLEAILAILLIGLILLQQGEGSLGAAFGGSDSLGTFRVKRGMELYMFVTTIVVAILFAGTALLALFV
jgi:protein translocase SecG subunit